MKDSENSQKSAEVLYQDNVTAPLDQEDERGIDEDDGEEGD